MTDVRALNDEDLLASTRGLVCRACGVEADLLLHLGEIDERKLYLARAYSSMFAFCTRELGFSEGAAYNRILVARTARKLPAIIETVRAGGVHLAGLRLLAPHLTQENHEHLLARAAGRTKEEVAELVAALAPQPLPPTMIRKLPVVPVAEDAYRVQLTISREFRDEIREAQALLRHRVPDGDLATIFRTALKLLVAEVKKERFGVGRKPRAGGQPSARTTSRHVPDAIKRAVYQRDGGQCTFVDRRGKRCGETAALELDHIEGFARTRRHDLDKLRLLCRAHNQYTADQMYGRAFMDAARGLTCPGTSPASRAPS